MSGASLLFPMTDDELDIFISAGLLHDGMKSGKSQANEKFTVHEHPILMGDAILNDPLAELLLDKDTILTISNAIKCHMGQWDTNRYSKVVLPKPQTKLEMFLHLADYLASRKILELNFDIPISR
jgi:hypothetical protein